MRRYTKALGAMTIGLGIGSVAFSGTAYAAPPVEHEHYEFAESTTFDECGFTIRSDYTASGTVMIKEVAGSDGEAYLGQDNYRFRNVLTNVDTGEHFVVSGKGMFKEMTGVHVEGDIWEFTTQDVGQPLVIEDSDGNIVLRDRGRITYRALFDTLGDGQPGGVIIEEEITGVSGPHPSLSADFCEIATDLIGSP